MTQTIDLGYRPRGWQEKVHRAFKRFRVLAVHRRAGKTTAAIMELVDAGLQAKHKNELYVYVAPFLKQAKQIAWSELKRVVEPLRIRGVVDVSEGELQVRIKNGAVIRLFGADNPDALRGLRIDGAVLDEPAWMKPEAWFEVIQPALADRLGWGLFIGTPHGVNLFSELFYKAAQQDEWEALRFTVYQTEALPGEEVARLKREMSPLAFAREFECDFTASGDDQLISLADAELAATREYADAEFMMAPKVLGVDPARFGDDRSVIVRRQGIAMFPPIIMHGVDNMVLANRVAQEIGLWQPDAVFIDAGGGAGVIDRLRQLQYSVVEVPFGGKALAPGLYLNRRTEMWFEMREWLLSGGSIPDEMALKTELATPIYWYDAQGRKVLEPKDKIKERLPGAGSPDIADALALTFAAPVAPRPVAGWHTLRPKDSGQEYDPFKDL